MGLVLQNLNLRSFEELFRANEIDGATLANCTDDDLQLIGLDFRPKRARLRAAIEEFLQCGVKPEFIQRSKPSAANDTMPQSDATELELFSAYGRRKGQRNKGSSKPGFYY